MGSTERIIFIDRMIKANGKVTSDEVVVKFEVDKRTVKRDIELMRNNLNAPIVFSRNVMGYVYQGDFDFIDCVDEKILISYLFIKNILLSDNYVPIFSDKIIKEIENQLPDQYRFIADNIIFEVSEYEPVAKPVLKTVIISMIKKKPVIFTYVNAKGERDERVVEPLRLIHNTGKWYILGSDPAKNALRVFSMSRIDHVVISDSLFKNDFTNQEIDEFVNGTFGIIKGKSEEPVVLRFYYPVNVRVARQVWHKDQKMRQGKNDRGEYIELELPIGIDDELIGRVLRHGSYGEIISPEHVRLKWLNEVKRMYEVFNRDK